MISSSLQIIAHFVHPGTPSCSNIIASNYCAFCAPRYPKLQQPQEFETPFSDATVNFRIANAEILLHEDARVEFLESGKDESPGKTPGKTRGGSIFGRFFGN
jgi:hypothetical protein